MAYSSVLYRTHSFLRMLWAAVIALSLVVTPFPGARPSVAQAQTPGIFAVKVIVERVQALDNSDGGYKGKPDMYARIRINGNQRKTSAIDGESDISPNWTHVVQVDAALQPSVPVSIEILDSDWPDKDDKIDLNPLPERDLQFSVDLTPCGVHGSGGEQTCGTTLVSTGDGKNKATIAYRIEVSLAVAGSSVAVIIEEVVGIDPVKIEDEGIDFDVLPDFYGKIRIGADREKVTVGERKDTNDNDITPNWVHVESIDFAQTPIVPIEIEIWDFDNLTDDDQIDAAVDPDSRTVRLEVNTTTCEITGDIMGGACSMHLPSIGQSEKRAKIKVRVEVIREPVVAPPVDLVATALEVTQVIQDLNNTVPPIEGKRTFVRLHGFSLNGTQRTTARLRVVGLEPTPFDITLEPENEGASGDIDVQPIPRREDINHSFLFELPSQARIGKIWLYGEINPQIETQDRSPIEQTYANNFAEAYVTYEKVPGLKIFLYNIGVGNKESPEYPDAKHTGLLMSQVRATYPAHDILFSTSQLYLGNDGESCDDVNRELFRKYALDSYPAYSANDPTRARHFGLSTRIYKGCSRGHPSLVASGPGFDTNYTWRTEQSAADIWGAHELGHTYSLDEAEYCGAKNGDPYPYEGGRISRHLEGREALFGFDARTREVISPSRYDMMTYCDNYGIWISDYTYKRLKNFFQSSNMTAAVGSLAELRTERMLLVGTIDEEQGTVTLEPIYVIPDALAVSPAQLGEYRIVQRATNGLMLSEYPFTPSAETDGSRLFSFGEFVPFMGTTKTIEIWHGTKLLGSRTLSSHAPSVTLLYPNGGEVLAGGPIAVTWTAEDPDGDPLAFTVQYSPDEGAPWETLALDLTENSITLDSTSLRAGHQARFRVWATDGIRTAADTSDGPFVVPNHPPVATIASPLEGESVASRQTLYLEAAATDQDVPWLQDSQMKWLSNINGLLATGLSASVSGLSPGLHTITFQVDDGMGGTAADSVQVNVVGDVSQLPPAPNGLRLDPTMIVMEPDKGQAEATVRVDNANLGGDIRWNVVSDKPWLALDAAGGSTPGELGIEFAGYDLPAGSHTAVLTFTSEDVPGVQRAVRILAVREANVAVALSDLPNSVSPGDTLRFTTNIRNRGPASLGKFTVISRFPDGVTITGVAPAENCTYDKSSVACSFEGAAVGGDRVLSVDTSIAPTLAAGERITNAILVTQDRQGTPAVLAEATASIVVAFRTHAYIPTILRDWAPDFVGDTDLVVSGLSVSDKGFEVTIRNNGREPVLPGTDFWVDAYFMAPVAPLTVNQTWQRIGAKGGAVWGVIGAEAPLKQGEDYILSINDQFFHAAQSVIPPVIPANTVVYVQVDSANIATDYGGVLEGHEKRRERYNNITGVMLTAPVSTQSWGVHGEDAATASAAAMLQRLPR